MMINNRTLVDHKKILITGANGLLGGKIVKQLLEKTDFDVITLASSEEKVNAMVEREAICDRTRITFLSNDDFLYKEIDLGAVYGAVHLAFSVRMRPKADIAASLDFSLAIFEKLTTIAVDRVINLSSVSVYGDQDEIYTESTTPAPENPYAMAKYAAEVIFNAQMKQSGIHNYTNLRLDSVVQSQNLVRALCRDAKEGGKLILRGGRQRFSYIDVDDAAQSVIAMLISSDGWEKIYNVGWNCRRYTLVEVANIVAQVAEKQGYGHPAIDLYEQDIMLWAGMDASRFMNHTGWRPIYDLADMVERIMLNE